MKRFIILLLFLSQSMYAQIIMKVSPRYVLIDSDAGVGNIDDEIIVYRLINGESVPIGRVKIVKMQNGKTAAKIIEESKGYKIRKTDFIKSQVSVFSEVGEISKKDDSSNKLNNNKISLGFGIGLSIPTGKVNKYWNIGPCFGVQLSESLSPSLSIGCRGSFAYNMLNEDNFRSEIGYASGINLTIVGMSYSFDVSPFLRFNLSNNTNSKSYPFLEGGCGLYSLNYLITVKASYMGYGLSDSVDEHDQKYGFSIGGGIHSEFMEKKKKRYFEIIILYHSIATQEIKTEIISIMACFLR